MDPGDPDSASVSQVPVAGNGWRQVGEVFRASLGLGLTSFGGPVAHIGYFHALYVKKKRWIGESDYLDLVTLCQILPGPASSQLGMAIGTLRAGWAGAVASWVGFTLPSALLMAGFALALRGSDLAAAPWIHGLKLVALAVVFQAVVGMWKKMVTGRLLATVALASMVVMLVSGQVWAQIAVIASAAGVGMLTGGQGAVPVREPLQVPYGPGTAAALLTGFVLMLAGAGVAAFHPHPLLGLAQVCVRTGALVYGGGHVVLPLLEVSFVRGGLVSGDVFLAGYGAAQAVPGPLFSFASYLGASVGGGWGALVATVSIFLPGSLLILGALPFWSRWRRNPRLLRSLSTVNASVVGILLAALYDPIWTSSVHRPADLAVGCGLVLALMVWDLPVIAVVALGVSAGFGLGWLGIF